MELIFKSIVIFTIFQRVLELFISKRNERYIISHGGKVIPETNYIFMVILHSCWLAYLLYASYSLELRFSIIPFVAFLVVFLMGQFFRIWAITTLGRRWSTRIMILPNTGVIKKGIFKYIRHPNYLGVILEIASLPLIAGLWETALIFSLVNGIILYYRIRLEEQMLSHYNDYKEQFLKKDSIMKVAVIGGGPVGLVTALYLAQEGHCVDVYEKSSWPIDKACGQGLMPSGVKKLSELGIVFEPEKECHAISGISYHDKNIRLEGLLNRKGLGIERKVLSTKIYEKAKTNQNIKLIPKTLVRETTLLSDGFKIKTNDSLQTYDYAFACDGLNSLLRKEYNNRKVRSAPWRLGAREHFEQAPWNNKVEVYWSEKAEAYVTPVSKTKVEVAFLWFDDFEVPQGSLRDALWDSFPELKEKIEFNKSQNDFRGYGPFSSCSKNVKVQRLFFLGDAYCFLDGITGEGMSLGFKGAQIVAKNFSQWSILNELRFKLHYWHYNFMVSLALSLSSHKRWRSFVFRFLKFFPQSFNIMLSINDA